MHCYSDIELFNFIHQLHTPSLCVAQSSTCLPRCWTTLLDKLYPGIATALMACIHPVVNRPRLTNTNLNDRKSPHYILEM